MVLRCIFMTVVCPVFFFFYIAIERYKLIVNKCHKAYITTQNNRFQSSGVQRKVNQTPRLEAPIKENHHVYQ